MSEILLVDIKSLAGSIATMANWLTAWVITVIANLLLNWSTGGSRKPREGRRKIFSFPSGLLQLGFLLGWQTKLGAGWPLLMVASTGATASLIPVAVVFYLKGFISESSYFFSVLGILSMVGLVVFVLAFSLGPGSVPWVVMSEAHLALPAFCFKLIWEFGLISLFHGDRLASRLWRRRNNILLANIKSLAGSIATMANWLTAWVITVIANLLLNWSTGGTVTIYAVLSAFTVMFVLLQGPGNQGKDAGRYSVFLQISFCLKIGFIVFVLQRLGLSLAL